MIINAKDHIPVLLKPVADALFPIIKTVSPASPRLILDATFGNGGYTSHLLTSAPSPLRVIGLDRDPHAFARAEYMSKLPQYE